MKYSQQQILKLNEFYQSGLNKYEACKRAGVAAGSFTYLMKKFGFSTRPSGFQLGNKTKGQFKLGEQVELVCLVCNIKFKIPIWSFKQGRKCCSRKCHLERLRQNNLGEKHWNWQGGISNRWDKLHNSSEYKKWRMSIFKRDWFTCQKCGSPRTRKNPLHAHHIKPKSVYPDLILDIDNGLTLCKTCHVKLHREMHKSRHG